jgi:hypothetical protein
MKKYFHGVVIYNYGIPAKHKAESNHGDTVLLFR